MDLLKKAKMTTCALHMQEFLMTSTFPDKWMGPVLIKNVGTGILIIFLYNGPRVGIQTNSFLICGHLQYPVNHMIQGCEIGIVQPVGTDLFVSSLCLEIPKIPGIIALM